MAAIVPAVFTTACSQMKARDLMTDGLNAMNAQQYTQAASDFEQVVQLQPRNLDAARNLALAYKAQINPNDASTSDQAVQRTITEYKQILADYPTDSVDMIALGDLYSSVGDYSDARGDYNNAEKTTPNSARAAEALGSLEWQETNAQLQSTRNRIGLDPSAPFVDNQTDPSIKRQCIALRSTLEPEIDDALLQVQKALQIRPAYADAMTALNLIYREKADLACGQSQVEIQADLSQASSWYAKAVAERKAEQAQQNKQNTQGGVVLDAQN